MMRCRHYHFTAVNPQFHTKTQEQFFSLTARNFESNSENVPTMSILTDSCTIKIFSKGKSNGENWRVAVKNV